MPTYNADTTAGSDVLIRKIIASTTAGGTAKTVGQLWPRGDKPPNS